MVQKLHGRSEMARIEDVVIGQEHEKFRLGYCNQTVEIADRTDIAFGAHVVDPFIAEGMHDVRCVVIGCVVAYDQAEARERLCEDALDTFGEPPGPIERGNTHCDFRDAHREPFSDPYACALCPRSDFFCIFLFPEAVVAGGGIEPVPMNADMSDDPAALTVAKRRTSGVASYGVLIRLLAVTALSGSVGRLHCIDDPDSFFVVVAAGI